MRKCFENFFSKKNLIFQRNVLQNGKGEFRKYCNLTPKLEEHVSLRNGTWRTKNWYQIDHWFKTHNLIPIFDASRAILRRYPIPQFWCQITISRSDRLKNVQNTFSAIFQPQVKIFESNLWQVWSHELLKHGVRAQVKVRESPVPENEKHGNLISPGLAETQLKFEQ